MEMASIERRLEASKEMRRLGAQTLDGLHYRLAVDTLSKQEIDDRLHI